MEKKLNEQFIVKNSKSKSEYIQKIDLFLNSHKGFRPTIKDNYAQKQLYTLDKSFSEKYGCELLDSKYFCHGSLHTSSYYYYVVYSGFHKRVKVVVVPAYYWGYGNNPRRAKFLDDDTLECSLSVVKRLYKKLVTEIVDHSILLRHRKNMRDEIIHCSKLPYCFNTKKKSCHIFENVTLNLEKELVTCKTQDLLLNGVSLKRNNNYSYTYTFDNFYHKFLGESTTWSNDFNKDITPLINQSIQDELEAINVKNAKVLTELNIS